MEHSRTSMLRTRWAAIGAAVAVTLGGGGLGMSHALTTSGEKPIYKRLDSPCRMADLRGAPFTVGPRSAPLGPNETYVLDGWGTEGDCTLPSDTAAIEVNVTAVDPTEPTFLRFWPGDGAEPDTANLNPTPGQPPTPNSVTIGLSSADGTFKVFNRFGSVSIIIDVVGVYDDHNHDDRYYTKAQVDAAVGEADDPEAAIAGDATELIGTTDEIIVSATVDTPTNGFVLVNTSTYATNSSGEVVIRCSLTTGTTLDSAAFNLTTVLANDYQSIGNTRGFTINSGSPAQLTVNLVCDTTGGTVQLFDTLMTVSFIPDSDAT